VTVDQAIDRSISLDVIVHLDDVSADDIATLEYECEDYVDVVRQYGHIEFWGTRDDGREWCIHATPAPA
jgi:hypothetical protein